MDPHPFSLRPFPGEKSSPGLTVAGTIGRRGRRLSIACAILGNLSDLAIPPRADSPERRGRLWEETCLELFLAERGEERYWEFHLSPAGHWNVYRFASYRYGMREEEAIPSLSVQGSPEPGALRLSAEIALEPILPARVPIEASVCAVLKSPSGEASHWALAHPGSRPDFHRREGFLLEFPAE